MDKLSYRIQKNLTISEEQKQLILANKDTMTINQLSILLGLPFQKTYNNLKILGLTEKRESKPAKVINFDNNEYFDIKEFAKYYKY